LIVLLSLGGSLVESMSWYKFLMAFLCIINVVTYGGAAWFFISEADSGKGFLRPK